MIQESFSELASQRELIRQLHSLVEGALGSFQLFGERSRNQVPEPSIQAPDPDLSTQKTLDSLYRLEQPIDHSVDLAIARFDEHHKAAIIAIASEAVADEYIASKNELALALGNCIDSAKFVLDAICDVFPVDKRR